MSRPSSSSHTGAQAQEQTLHIYVYAIPSPLHNIPHKNLYSSNNPHTTQQQKRRKINHQRCFAVKSREKWRSSFVRLCYETYRSVSLAKICLPICWTLTELILLFQRTFWWALRIICIFVSFHDLHLHIHSHSLQYDFTNKVVLFCAQTKICVNVHFAPIICSGLYRAAGRSSRTKDKENANLVNETHFY